MMPYQLLLSEGRIGSLTVRNRVVLPPLEVGMANFDGTPSEQLIDYYEARAKDGLGLLITGITRVNEYYGAGLPRQLAMTSDRHIEPFARMVECLHVHGTKVFCQLHHPGRQSNSLMIGSWPLMERIGRMWPGYWKFFFKLVPAAEKFAKTGLVPSVVAPSAVACEYSRQKTRALASRISFAWGVRTWPIRRGRKRSVRGASRTSNAASVVCGALNPFWPMPRKTSRLNAPSIPTLAANARRPNR
ncbi:hypothetical protein KN63_00890 [Smithella sp. F21]|nr:hypothetical protein KN63_00890 [Smithella sp. F21]